MPIMDDLDAIVHKSEDAAAKALCQKSCPHPNCKCPRLWRGQISRASGALDAIGFRELVEALMPFAEYGRLDTGVGRPVLAGICGPGYSAQITYADLSRAAAVIAKMEAGNADG